VKGETISMLLVRIGTTSLQVTMMCMRRHYHRYIGKKVRITLGDFVLSTQKLASKECFYDLKVQTIVSRTNYHSYLLAAS
jgi:hypothetical protein